MRFEGIGQMLSRQCTKEGIEFRQVRFEGEGRSHPGDVWRSGAEVSQLWFEEVGQRLAR